MKEEHEDRMRMHAEEMLRGHVTRWLRSAVELLTGEDPGWEATIPEMVDTIRRHGGWDEDGHPWGMMIDSSCAVAWVAFGSRFVELDLDRLSQGISVTPPVSLV